MSSPSARMPFVDLLRAVASHLVVWHHLAFYGPLSATLQSVAPLFIGLLVDYARMAVQVFFVLGGFITARGLTKGGPTTLAGVWSFVWRRYVRIGLPYLATLALAIAANALADVWMDDEAISAAPTAPQILAHAVYLHDILGFEALTTGIWYLAIDFQIGLLVMVIVAGSAGVARLLGRPLPGSGLAIAKGVLAALAVASLFWFNRDAHYDIWAVYFFGAYFLGMVLGWALSGGLPTWSFWAYLALVVGAGAMDGRTRLFVAAGTALLVFFAGQTGVLGSWPRSRLASWSGRTSYSLFLVHFPVCLVVIAATSRFLPLTPAVAAGGMVVAWLLSMAVATAFHHVVEARCMAASKRTSGERLPVRTDRG